MVGCSVHVIDSPTDLSSLELIGSGAAPLDPERERACAERLGCPVVLQASLGGFVASSALILASPGASAFNHLLPSPLPLR